jgi:hypothetical protein
MSFVWALAAAPPVSPPPLHAFARDVGTIPLAVPSPIV